MFHFEDSEIVATTDPLSNLQIAIQASRVLHSARIRMTQEETDEFVNWFESISGNFIEPAPIYYPIPLSAVQEELPLLPLLPQNEQPESFMPDIDDILDELFEEEPPEIVPLCSLSFRYNSNKNALT